MGKMGKFPQRTVFCLTTFAFILLVAGEAVSNPIAFIENTGGIGTKVMRRPKAPSVPTAPLDPNASVHHTLDEVNQILGTLGHASSGAVMGLTGVSITDCASAVKDEDLAAITCTQFLNKLSQCDSLAHVKPLLQQAKNKQKKNPHSKEPCFTNKKKGKKG